MKRNLAQKLIEAHRVEGEMSVGSHIALRIAQTLTQDATGTTVMLEFEAMGIPRVRTELSVQYVDHNLLQEDFKNADDHLFLRSAARKFGLWYSGPGNGISHVVHMERFGIPGKSLLGSDSHTPAAGSLGMLAIGAGGLEVALAMAGQPFRLRMPAIWGIKLTGHLPPWVSAKDVILELLRRHDVDGGVDRILEFHGPGLACLSAMDRHVMANMGTELGATSSVFPSDAVVRAFLARQGRERDWEALSADEGADYDEHEEVNLSQLQPLIACPSSPGNVRPVEEVAGADIYQSYIGSSANPGLRDFAIAALMMEGRQVHPGVSLDINPSSRQVLHQMTSMGYLGKLIAAGARIHQAGCNGCIGMGQAPATGRRSLRTVPRNFPGRSGTQEDQVYLCSPETAAASALKGKITDPRTLGIPWPEIREPGSAAIPNDTLLAPGEEDEVELVKGPNIQRLPSFDPLPEVLEGPVLLKAGNHVSTDEILPAGARVLPLRSNLAALSRFAFRGVDESCYDRARQVKDRHLFVVAGENYGQGSSREHAALAPRYLGFRAVVARSFARIHRQNLINFGILPLRLVRGSDFDQFAQEDDLRIELPREALEQHSRLQVHNLTRNADVEVEHALSPQEAEIVRAGSLINVMRKNQSCSGS